MTPIQRLLKLKPSLFSPSVVRGVTNPDGGLSSFSSENGQYVVDSAIGETGSFRYDPIGSGIKSTQQLNVDWTAFENHVFFNSAEVKVNAAFNKIFDRYPFDGTRRETELFFDGMTGYENYVYTNLPKNKGYLFFSGSNPGDANGRGTFVTVKDSAGSSFPLLTRVPNGASRLDPTTSSISFEMQICVATGSNLNQIVFQKYNPALEQGFGCFLSQSSNPLTADLTFFVASGSVSTMSTSLPLVKGVWTPVSFVWNRQSGNNRIFGYVSGSLVASSSQVTIRSLGITSASFILGSGSNITTPVFEPQQTFSGAIDEFRYWKKIIAPADMVLNQSGSVYAQPDLALYFKFNEPSGSSTNLVLDHSGQGMHGTLNSYALSTLRVRNIATGAYFGPSPMIYEDERKCPILFPDQPDVVSYRETLLDDATSYDSYNPNLIIKLVPKHFLTMGQEEDALETEEGGINTLEYGSEPNTARLGGTQSILSLLYLWAGFFDELKLFLDAFSTLRHVDYDSEDTVPDAFLMQLAKFYGLELPPLFNNSSINQFINGSNITPDIVNSENTLQYLQNQVWRRILVNANDILKSKGTVHGIKALLRAVGIEGDNIFRFREYGGPTQRTLTGLRETRNEVGAMLSFLSGGYIRSPELSGSRIEPGTPLPIGSFVYDSNGKPTDTTSRHDGLFTSGSWTFEAIYNFPGLPTTSSIQSLVRVMSTGSTADENVLLNLVATSGSGLTLVARPNSAMNATVLTMSLGVPTIMDGQPWNISFGRTRGDLIGQVSSSYFLRAGRNSLGVVAEVYTTSSLFDDNFNGNPANNLWQVRDGTGSVPFLAIGSGSNAIPTNTNFANENNLQIFTGRVGQIRWWTKALSVDEWSEHVRDYKSLGVSNPKVNFNFDTTVSGSFERLRGDWSTDQPTIQTTNAGTLEVFDFSQNNFHATGSRFPASSTIVLPQRFYYSFLSPSFDEGVTAEKVRVRSYQDLTNVLGDEAQYSSPAPVYEISQEQIPQDTGRFSIDFSLTDALDQDIIGMFSSLDEFNNYIGSPNQMFSEDYVDLENLQDIYFHRLTSKLNVRGFYDFYKWFNTNLGSLIEQLIPGKTSFDGINYVVTSHVLERNKVRYHSEDMYLGESNRNKQKEQLYLQLFTGMLRKY